MRMYLWVSAGNFCKQECYIEGGDVGFSFF